MIYPVVETCCPPPLNFSDSEALWILWHVIVRCELNEAKNVTELWQKHSFSKKHFFRKVLKCIFAHTKAAQSHSGSAPKIFLFCTFEFSQSLELSPLFFHYFSIWFFTHRHTQTIKKSCTNTQNDVLLVELWFFFVLFS